MPELPEVETIRMQLEKFLVGHAIEDIEIRNERYEISDKAKAIGKKIANVQRFAKVLSINLSNDISIVIHVKLTGQLIYRGPNLKSPGKLSSKVTGGIPGLPDGAIAKAGRHTHVIFHLNKGGELYYNDVRRFGWIKLIETSKLKAENGFIGKLGPEPFKDLTFEYFKNTLSKSGRNIKVLLMDQTKIGGIGNIYANDALWLARISPMRASKNLGNEEMKKLYDAIHEVLKSGLKYGGASELAFVTPDGGEGQYQKHSLVYGRQGEICKNCKKEKIIKIFTGGRGTYYCPACQR